jgi:hypothetical protein
MHNQASGQIIVWYLKGTAITGNAVIGTAGAPWQVVGAADLNGDKYSDILLRNQTSGQVIVWYMKDTKITGNATIGTAAIPWEITLP